MSDEKKNEMKQITVRLKHDRAKKFKLLAGINDTTMQVVLEKAAETYIKKHAQKIQES